MLILSLLDQPLLLIAWLFAIVLVLTIHEFSHALADTLLGDQTAKDAGRLTLNPIAHISWLGFFMLLVIGFGWGKPVPYNPYNLKYPRFGPAIIAAAGPFSNFVAAIIFIGIFKILFSGLNPLFLIAASGVPGELNLLAAFLSLLIFINVVLMIFNLIPLPPLDGSKILLSFLSGQRFSAVRNFLEEQGPFILLFIIVLDSILHTDILSSLFQIILEFIYKLFI